ncbi:MAG: hypothetical protein R6V53_00045 [Candidatus Woesearchaeota archaeon]
MKYVLINGTEDERKELIDELHSIEYERRKSFHERMLYTIDDTARHAESLDEQLALQEKWEKEVPEFITDIVMNGSCEEKVMQALAENKSINGHRHYLDDCDCDYVLSMGKVSPRLSALQEKVYKKNDVSVLDISDVQDKAQYIMELILAAPRSYQVPQAEFHTGTSYQSGMH